MTSVQPGEPTSWRIRDRLVDEPDGHEVDGQAPDQLGEWEPSGLDQADVVRGGVLDDLALGQGLARAPGEGGPRAVDRRGFDAVAQQRDGDLEARQGQGVAVLDEPDEQHVVEALGRAGQLGA